MNQTPSGLPSKGGDQTCALGCPARAGAFLLHPTKILTDSRLSSRSQALHRQLKQIGGEALSLLLGFRPCVLDDAPERLSVTLLHWNPPEQGPKQTEHALRERDTACRSAESPRVKLLR